MRRALNAYSSKYTLYIYYIYSIYIYINDTLYIILIPQFKLSYIYVNVVPIYRFLLVI